MTEETRKAIIVLGMHRSGTSALTGVMGLLGARLPARLMPITPDNPKGYFESEHIVAIHDRILASAGTTWSSWEEISEAWFLSEPSHAFVDELVEAISEDYGEAPLFVVKDPRMCRLIPLWYRVLDRIDVKPCFAIPLRNPVEVARSLQNRDGLPLAHGCLLWLCHVLDAEHHTRGHPRVFLRYPDLLARPRSVIDRLGTGLGVAWPRQVESSLGEIEDFLDPSLRHQIAHVGEIDDMGDFSPWLRQAYECCDALVRSPTDRAVRRRLDSLHAAFAASDAAFTPVFKHQAERHSTGLAALRETLAARQTELASLGQALTERDNRIVALGDTLGERDTRLAALDQTLAEREAKIAALDQTLTGRDRDLGGLRDELAAQDARLTALDQALAERGAKVAALDQTLVEREAKIAALDQTLAEREAKIAALDQALAERKAKIVALDQALAERDREMSWLRDALAERNAKVAAFDETLAKREANVAALGQEVVNLRSQLAGKAAELDRLFASISWRLTSPFRKACVKLSHVARLGTQRVELRPLNQIKREAQAGSVIEWQMMGDDANFEIDLSRTGPLSHGHYRLMIELPKGLTALNSPSLYVDSGNGLSESECLKLNFAERGRIGIANFSLAKGACALRFDPSVHPGRIAIGRAWLRRMSRIEYYSRLIARLLRHRINSPADLARAVKRAITALASGGPRRLAAELRSTESRDFDQRGDYQHWIERYDTMTEADKDALRRRMQSLAWRPLISVIMPVHNTPEAFLRKAIESVREQINDHWELCIADDCSTAVHVRKVLDYYAKLDPRIRVCFRTTNGGIAEASNSALAIAKGEFVALLDHDDEIPPHALALVAEAIAAQPDVDLIFSDEDKLDAQGRRFDPYFKSDWNPALMLSQNVFCHLGVYRRSLVEKIGGFRLGFEGSQDHDLVLRCSRETTPERIRHIPKILYHWRAIESSTAADSGVKPYAWDAGRRAIEEHLAQKNIHAKVEHASRADCYYQVEYAVPTPPSARQHPHSDHRQTGADQALSRLDPRAHDL